jgi:hypothetical protein
MVDYTPEDLASLAAAIYGEARSESREGQDAVAHVSINRASLGDVSVADAVYGSGGALYGQFSFANPGEYSKTIGDAPRNDPTGWASAIAVAQDALQGKTTDPTGGASHYYNPNIRVPGWASTMPKTTKIGNHQFHKASDAETRSVTRASAFSGHRREPGVGHMQPGIFGHDVMSALHVLVPTGKAVSQVDHAVNALASNTESQFTSQFAPGQASSMPWTDSFAPAPEYVPSTPAASRFDQTFRRSFPTEPQRPPMTPGTSDTARTAAYRGLADTLAQAGVSGLNGQATPQSREAFEDNGKADVRLDHSPMPEQTEFDEPYAAQDFTIPTPKPAPPIFAAPVPAPAPRNRIGVQDPPTATHPTRSVPIPTPRPTNGQTGNAVLDGRKRVAELLVRRYLSPAGRPMGIEITSPGRKAVARALLKAQATAQPS